VLNTKRDVPENIFIEPSSGEIFKTNDAKHGYEGIEAIWNHSNYWVNMQDASIHVCKSLSHIHFFKF
jgi:hypothetical protein